MSYTPDLLLKNVRPVSRNHDGSRQVDLRVNGGEIAEIGRDLSAGDSEEQFDAGGSYLSPGWMDMHVHLREPGYEHKETIETGCRAAAAGGFTEVACMPNTNPPIHTRDVVEFIRKKADRLPVDVHPIGCVTKERKGRSIAEMADMKEGGAVAFSDDGDPVYNAELMRVALEYSSMLGMPVINHEEELSLSRPGYMHEGRVSARLGLEGSPGIAEEVMIARDLMLAEITGGHIHVAHISTAKAVELIRRAKNEGINVTAEVCPHHFDLTDAEVEKRDFDTNVKMHPPLRTQEDVDAVSGGLADGTIDVICSDHAPHSVEEKEVEFIYAPNGIIGLETAWSVSVRRLLEPGVLELRQLIQKFVDRPRKILNLEVPVIEKGAKANFTLFNREEKWLYEKKRVQSKSHNSPYLNSEMTGRAEAIYNKRQWVVNKIPKNRE